MVENSPPLSKDVKKKALARVLQKRKQSLGAERLVSGGQAESGIPEAFYKFDQFAAYQSIKTHHVVADQIGIDSPFFLTHEGCAHDTTRINGRDLVNYGTYNYLDLNGHPRVNKSALDAIGQYGTSACASRLIAGERPPHRALEEALANLYGTEDALCFVSGHATNVSTIGTLFGPTDLIVHDRLIHSSVLQGAHLSRAKRQPFAHNDWQELDDMLTRSRHHFEKVLVCIEGVYSMDGDFPQLDRFVEVTRKHHALLMVDEAHSLGVLGATGRGLGEHFGVASDDVDIWMGTLSKTLAGCGGYIAGSASLIELLKYSASGFVYSVGMSPALAAGSLEALKIMLEEPERVAMLNRNGRLFHDLAAEHGLDTGLSQGLNVIPVIVGDSIQAINASQILIRNGIYVSPLIHPAVEENAARLRFFISSAHSEEQIRQTVIATADAIRDSKRSETGG